MRELAALETQHEQRKAEFGELQDGLEQQVCGQQREGGREGGREREREREQERERERERERVRESTAVLLAPPSLSQRLEVEGEQRRLTEEEEELRAQEEVSGAGRVLRLHLAIE